MRTEGNVSKVAICKKCDNFILACHIDYLNKPIEKEFTDFSNDGFIIKLEKIKQTKAREMGDYLECIEGKCKRK